MRRIKMMNFFLMPKNAETHIINNVKTSLHIASFKENKKSRLGIYSKTRTSLEHEDFPSPGLILISNSTNNANEINSGAYVPLAAE